MVIKKVASGIHMLFILLMRKSSSWKWTERAAEIAVGIVTVVTLLRAKKFSLVESKLNLPIRIWLCECACAEKENAPRHFNFGRQFSLILQDLSSWWNIYLPLKIFTPYTFHDYASSGSADKKNVFMILNEISSQSNENFCKIKYPDKRKMSVWEAEEQTLVVLCTFLPLKSHFTCHVLVLVADVPATAGGGCHFICYHHRKEIVFKITQRSPRKKMCCNNYR